MDKKISKLIVLGIVILNCLFITSVSADNQISELAFCTTTSAIWRFAGYAFLGIRIIIPVIIIVLGIIDLAKVIIGSDDDLIAKATKNLMRRFILAIVIFFVPLIVSVAMSLISSATTYMDNIEDCHICLVKPLSAECQNAVDEAEAAREDRVEESKGDNGSTVSGVCYYCPNTNSYTWSETNLRTCTISYTYKTKTECNAANNSTGGTIIGNDEFLKETGKDGLIEVKDGIFYKPSGVENGHDNSKGSAPYGYNIFFYNRLVRFIEAAKAAGHTIEMCTTQDCAWRPYSRQEYYYGCYINQNCNYGNVAAVPGTSNHGWGIASDLTYDTTSAIHWAHANATAFGLAFTVASENWHIEPAKVVIQ